MSTEFRLLIVPRVQRDKAGHAQAQIQTLATGPTCGVPLATLWPMRWTTKSAKIRTQDLQYSVEHPITALLQACQCVARAGIITKV